VTLPRIRARTLAGGGIFALTVAVFVMIFVKPELAENDLFKTLAQAVVVQGLIGLAMAFYFTAKERDPHPEQVEVVNDQDDPVPTESIEEEG
jgi:lipopolysaccharide export LptBFGC system permease protein LptF